MFPRNPESEIVIVLGLVLLLLGFFSPRAGLTRSLYLQWSKIENERIN
jgi:hypothetical protein